MTTKHLKNYQFIGPFAKILFLFWLNMSKAANKMSVIQLNTEDLNYYQLHQASVKMRYNSWVILLALTFFSFTLETLWQDVQKKEKADVFWNWLNVQTVLYGYTTVAVIRSTCSTYHFSKATHQSFLLKYIFSTNAVTQKKNLNT